MVSRPFATVALSGWYHCSSELRTKPFSYPQFEGSGAPLPLNSSDQARFQVPPAVTICCGGAPPFPVPAPPVPPVPMLPPVACPPAPPPVPAEPPVACPPAPPVPVGAPPPPPVAWPPAPARPPLPPAGLPPLA